MKKTVFALVAAAVVSGAPLAVSGAFAMENELTMLEQAVNKEFVRYGLEGIDMGDLTVNQLAEIRAVVNGSDYSDAEIKQRLETIVTQ